jgi:hypothetical protein
MTQSSFPFENADTNETQYSRLLRHLTKFGRGGVNGVPGDNNLKVSAGTGMTVSVSSGQALVRGHFYISTAAEVLNIGASGALPRIDSVVLRLDPSADSIILAIVAGTPNATPSAPTLTQNDTTVFELLLANVLVAAGVSNITEGAISDFRSFMTEVWTTVARPTGQLGLTGYNTTTQKLETWNGSAWVEVTPTALDASVITSGIFNTARIPNLDAAKITSGAFDAARIPTLDAAKIGTGTFVADRIPSLDTSKLTTGILPLARGGVGSDTQAGARTNIGAAAQTAMTQAQADIDALQSAVAGKAALVHTHDASAVVSGTLATARIPNLDASKITAGTLSRPVSTSSACTLGASTITSIGAPNAAFAITSSGNGFFNNGLTSPHVYNTGVGGSYRAVWVQSDGVLGNTASTKRVKQDIVDSELSANVVEQLQLREFKYIADVKNFGDDAETRVGLIAEEILEIPGMDKFVFFDIDEKGNKIPAGIHYEFLALALIPTIQKQGKQISDIESRLAKLEK